MKAIKRQFKEFWLYFKCMHKGANVGTSNSTLKGNMFTFLVVLIAVMMFSIQMQSSQIGFSFNMFHAFLVGAAFGTGVTLRIKPSFLSVAPFSPKQRVVYSYLSTLLLVIIAWIIWTILTLAFLGVIALIAFLVSGESAFEASETIIKVSDYFAGMDFLFGLYLWLSVYAMSFIPRTKHRNIAFSVWFAVTEALVLVLVNACNNAWAAQSNVDGWFMFATEVGTQIEYLAQPWLPLLIAGLLSLGAFAASLVMSIRFFRSTKI